jgi:hypothetical protein
MTEYKIKLRHMPSVWVETTAKPILVESLDVPNENALVKVDSCYIETLSLSNSALGAHPYDLDNWIANKI